jgi:hypothetical protein
VYSVIFQFKAAPITVVLTRTIHACKDNTYRRTIFNYRDKTIIAKKNDRLKGLFNNIMQKTIVNILLRKQLI